MPLILGAMECRDRLVVCDADTPRLRVARARLCPPIAASIKLSRSGRLRVRRRSVLRIGSSGAEGPVATIIDRHSIPEECDQLNFRNILERGGRDIRGKALGARASHRPGRLLRHIAVALSPKGREQFANADNSRRLRRFHATLHPARVSEGRTRQPMAAVVASTRLS